ncbi:MAG: hypothetical protein ACW967_05825 [Candidatus Hodarchaeales archaeon]|jgi:hypothetical protein
MNFDEKSIKIEIPALKKEIIVTITSSTTVQDVINYLVDHYNQEESEDLKKRIREKLVLTRNQNNDF